MARLVQCKDITMDYDTSTDAQYIESETLHGGISECMQIKRLTEELYCCCCYCSCT